MLTGLTRQVRHISRGRLRLDTPPRYRGTTPHQPGGLASRRRQKVCFLHESLAPRARPFPCLAPADTPARTRASGRCTHLQLCFPRTSQNLRLNTGGPSRVLELINKQLLYGRVSLKRDRSGFCGYAEYSITCAFNLLLFSASFAQNSSMEAGSATFACAGGGATPPRESTV